MTRPIEADEFARTMSDILGAVRKRSRAESPEIVRAGIVAGAKAWREQAKSKFGGISRGRNKNTYTYRKGGRTYTTGAYSRSIRSHMLSKGDNPTGEVGAPKMPGLPHLLEFGHAKVGGGSVRAIPHVRYAADTAFGAAERQAEASLDRIVEGVLDEL